MSKIRLFLVIVTSLLAVLVAITALIWLLSFYGLISAGDFPPVDDSKLQAVFLTNNQVYFGKLENLNGEYAKLTNVYYLRIAENLQQGSGESAQNLNLVKLGGELHGPEDAMYIPKDRIQFWENLQESSRVVRAIKSSTK